MRGISTVQDPEDSNNQVIIGALEKPPLPVIRRINPSRGYAATEEVNYEEYFTQIFGSKPNPNQYMNGAILNKLEPFVNPRTGDPVHLVTTFIMHPQSPAQGFNGAYYMVRHGDGSYDWGAIYDPANLPGGTELQGVRTIEKSPFPDEPEVYYFGGYAADYENVKNTAWIYKAVLRSTPAARGGTGRMTAPATVRAGARTAFDIRGRSMSGRAAERHTGLMVTRSAGYSFVVLNLVDSRRQSGLLNR